MDPAQVQPAYAAGVGIGRHGAKGDADAGALDQQIQQPDRQRGRAQHGQVIGRDSDGAELVAPRRQGQVQGDHVGTEQELRRALRDQADAQRRDAAGQVRLEHQRRDQEIADRHHRHHDR
ncbi:hypothetical protein D3C72_1912600 [compost metagenome]